MWLATDRGKKRKTKQKKILRSTGNHGKVEQPKKTSD